MANGSLFVPVEISSADQSIVLLMKEESTMLNTLKEQEQSPSGVTVMVHPAKSFMNALTPFRKLQKGAHFFTKGKKYRNYYSFKDDRSAMSELMVKLASLVPAGIGIGLMYGHSHSEFSKMDPAVIQNMVHQLGGYVALMLGIVGGDMMFSKFWNEHQREKNKKAAIGFFAPKEEANVAAEARIQLRQTLKSWFGERINIESIFDEAVVIKHSPRK